MSLGSRGGELMRIVARDRYVNGLNGEFLCIKGRFGHPFINHRGAHPHAADSLQERRQADSRHLGRSDSLHVAEASAKSNRRTALTRSACVGSPRLTNEALYSLHKFATEAGRH